MVFKKELGTSRKSGGHSDLEIIEVSYAHRAKRVCGELDICEG